MAQQIGYQSKFSNYPNKHRGFSLVAVAGMSLFVYLLTEPAGQSRNPLQISTQESASVAPPSTDAPVHTERESDLKENKTITSNTTSSISSPAALILNAGFEDDILPTQGWQFGIKDWNGSNHGVVLPPPIMYPDGLAPEGKQMAFLTKAGSWMSSSTDFRLTPNRSYQLTLMAGRRLESTFGPGQYKLQIFSGQKLLAEKVGQLPNAGEFIEERLELISPPSLQESQSNRPITIKITNIDARQVNIDNVRFTIENTVTEESEIIDPTSITNPPSPKGKTVAPPTPPKKELPPTVPAAIVLPAPENPAIKIMQNQATKTTGSAKPATPTPPQTLPYVLPEYGHLRVVPVDPNSTIAPEIKAMWAKGFYIHLKPDGNFGFNTDAPGPYLYLPVNRWKSENGVFTLTLDKVVYAFTLPMKESTGDTTLNTVDSTLNAFEMTYVAKEKGVR